MQTEQLKECVPVLSAIFVKWNWLAVVLVTFVLAFGSLSFQSGVTLQRQKGNILKNTEAYSRIEFELKELKDKLDTLISLVGSQNK